MFLQQTETLAASMKRYAPFQLESVLKVNPQLALRAFTDIQDWNASIPGSPALLSYHGLAYSALDAATLSREDLTFAQDTLRILSAFYGVLRPLDNICLLYTSLSALLPGGACRALPSAVFPFDAA